MTYKYGDKIQWWLGEIKVLAEVDGYVMVRYPGHVPFVVSVEQVKKAIQQIGKQKEPKCTTN